MRDRLMAETKAALKAQNKARLSALRLISAELQTRDIAAKASIPDQDIPAVLQKMIKQRRESLAIYEKAGRTEQAAAGSRRDRRDRGVPAQADERGRGQGRHCRRREGGRRGERPRRWARSWPCSKERYAGQMDFGKASGLVKELLK